MPIDLFGTRKLVEIFEDALGVTLPKTDTVLMLLAERLEQHGVFMAEAIDLVRDADALVESIPKDWQKLVKALLGLIDHGVRVGTRVSNAAQAAGKAAEEATALLGEIREHGIETQSSMVAKPKGESGGD